MIFNRNFFLPKNIPWLQWTGCLATTLSTIVVGITIGWVSPYLPQLTAEDSPLPITINEASWVVSMNNCGRILGAFFGAVSVHYFGSKRTLFLNAFPMLFFWSLIILADSPIWLYIARLTSGFSHGVAYSSLSLYLGEVSSPGIRGAVTSLAMVGVALGMLVGSVMGAYLSMTILAWISLGPTVGVILLFMWVPETPHYLIRKGKMGRAHRSIQRYNPGVNVKVEFESLQNFVSTSSALTYADCLREFVSLPNRKSSIIVVALFIFMQTSGINFLSFYTGIVLIKGGFVVILPATMVIILNGIGIIAGLSGMWLADTWGRRTLWNTASIVSCASLIMIGVHFSLLEDGFDSVALQWLFIPALVIWQVSTYVGIISIPIIVLGEFFPPNTKSIAACWVNVVGSTFGFLCTKSYQPMINAMGEAYVFWIHAMVMAVSAVFGFALLPETKGKSLQEIQELLTKK